ncbi:DHA2 family efflux MFS transporter permease subunit [Novosphingobium lentum]|uniref:DHA2 family efflux MFS transporter permease subunit n=1 Tax=Novosphingobium lentum TaxID=145287 RepID=UPI000A073399|nr:DHA2 family efflux MFS transporter permease subunit [Novosphingobium lentum]
MIETLPLPESLSSARVEGEHGRAVSWRTWTGFLFMCLGMFMAILDIQIVATSLPTIQKALGIATDQMSWVQTAYLIAEIVAIPLTGYLTRLLGMRRLFVVAITVFTLASAGCAASHDFTSLIAWRVLQGFAGGTLIPAVFSAVFLMFPLRLQGIATTIAGVAAVFAPTVGPIVGGWLTQTYSWHWLFLVNIVPGIIAAIGAAALLPRRPVDRAELRSVDALALAAMAVALTALEIGLKDAPSFGWASLRVLSLLGLFALCGLAFVARTLRSVHPVVELRSFADRNFTIGCILSFVLGIGLFGSTYLMPFFLGLVRGHGALEIGKIMLVTGMAQLLAAPVAVALERRVDPRLLTLLGFGMFAAGLWLSASQTKDTDFAQMMLPQVLRGASIMFCLLPPTRLALGRLPNHLVADGSGLFNLMRNLGGAIGLALIDTVIFSRGTDHARTIGESLRAGDVDVAVSIGIPRELFLAQAGRPASEAAQNMARPLIEKAALVQSINDAWMMIAVLTAAAVLLLPFVAKSRVAAPGQTE